MKKKPLDILWKNHDPGTWVILDPTMSKVIGYGETPEEAMKKAGIPTAMVKATKRNLARKRPVIMQVLDPSMKFF
jgi:predicted RNase H-like HicB family nuclease